MDAVRHLISRRRGTVLLLMALAMALRILVPAGFMPVSQGGTVTIQICTGAGPATMTAATAHEAAMPGMDHGPHHKADDRAGHDAPCAFSGLSLAATGGADAALLVAALLFVRAAGLRPAPARPLPAHPHLRPPSRGPPAIA